MAIDYGYEKKPTVRSIIFTAVPECEPSVAELVLLKIVAPIADKVKDGTVIHSERPKQYPNIPIIVRAQPRRRSRCGGYLWICLGITIERVMTASAHPML